jgi:NAD(P)-dependent dehydrogenase (short-subunit alcohol dehydrogenase family)
MTIADRAVLVTAGNRGIGPELVREALRRSAKCMRFDRNWKVDISQ